MPTAPLPYPPDAAAPADGLTPLFDLVYQTELRDVLGEKAYRKLAGDICSYLPTSLAKIRGVLLEGDEGDAGNLIHSLKGLAANLGLLRVKTHLEQIEERRKAGQPVAPAHLEDLDRASRQTISELSQPDA